VATISTWTAVLDHFYGNTALVSESVAMTCQPIAQPGPDGFAVPGIAEIIPLMPEHTCLASSQLLAGRYSKLRYQEGILIMHVGGEMRTSVRHAWNVGYGYCPRGHGKKPGPALVVISC